MAGKPKKPELRKAYMLRVRLTLAEQTLIEEAARHRGLEVSTWVRMEALEQARKLLAKT